MAEFAMLADLQRTSDPQIKVIIRPASSQAQDRESSPAKTRGPIHQCCVRKKFVVRYGIVGFNVPIDTL